MTIIEALKSGRRFRLNNWDKHAWVHPLNHDLERISFTVADFLSEDWEIEPLPEQTVTVSKAQIYKALSQTTVFTRGKEAGEVMFFRLLGFVE